LDGCRDSTYREIIREQLKKDRYQDATQTFCLIEILLYKQQAVMIFVVYLLNKERTNEAKQLADHFQSLELAAKHNSEINNDQFATTPEEWNKHTDNEFKKLFSPDNW
jgi:hypothetical protein